jgi:hypothetical protein
MQVRTLLVRDSLEAYLDESQGASPDAGAYGKGQPRQDRKVVCRPSHSGPLQVKWHPAHAVQNPSRGKARDQGSQRARRAKPEGQGEAKSQARGAREPRAKEPGSQGSGRISPSSGLALQNAATQLTTWAPTTRLEAARQLTPKGFGQHCRCETSSQ